MFVKFAPNPSAQVPPPSLPPFSVPVPKHLSPKKMSSGHQHSAPVKSNTVYAFARNIIRMSYLWCSHRHLNVLPRIVRGGCRSCGRKAPNRQECAGAGYGLVLVGVVWGARFASAAALAKVTVLWSVKVCTPASLVARSLIHPREYRLRTCFTLLSSCYRNSSRQPLPRNGGGCTARQHRQTHPFWSRCLPSPTNSALLRLYGFKRTPRLRITRWRSKSAPLPGRHEQYQGQSYAILSKHRC